MTPELKTLKDVNGNLVTIKMSDLIEFMIEDKFEIFGMDLKAILEIRKVYLTNGGGLPITAESIRGMYDDKKSHVRV